MGSRMLRWNNLNKVVCILAVVLLAPVAFSQNSYTLVGEVHDSIGSPLEFGNVYIYKAQDSSLITGALITDGDFASPLLQEQKIFIKITSFGNSDYYKSIENTGNTDTLSIGVIRLVPELSIGPVEVVYEVPIFENDGATTIVNVEKTILSASLTPLEILKKSPGVLVDGANVTVLGRGNAAIFLGGQRITVDQLNSIPVEQIVKFEIIKNPSARFDGDAAAVIRVITKNYYQEGVNVSISQAAQYPPFMSNTRLGVNYKRKKLSLKFNYGFTTGEQWNTNVQSTALEGVYSTDMNMRETTQILGNIVGGGIGYEIDSSQNLSIGYGGAFNGVGIDVFSENTITTSQQTRYDVSNIGDINLSNHNLLGNYQKRFDTLGSSFFVGVQYTTSDIRLTDKIVEDISINDVFQGRADRRVNSRNGFDILSSQVDLEKYLNKDTRITGGLKYSNARTSGEFVLDNLEQGVWVNDDLFSSTTQFDEDIYAAYSEFGTTFKTIEFLAGLRYEYTNARGVTTQQGQLSLNREYHWLLPSLSLTKSVNDKVAMTLSYTTATGRPSYNDLDPKVYYIDSLTSKQGNPLLLPQVDHAVGLAVNLGPMRLDLTYYRSINAFKDIVREGINGVNSVTLYKENVDADRFYGSLTIPYRNKVMMSYLYYLIGYDKVIGEFGDFSRFSLAPTHYVYLYNRFKVKDWFNIELTGSYTSGRFDGIYRDIPTYDLSIGLSREFFKKKLRCQLLMNDMFFTQRDAGTYYIGDYSVEYLKRSSSQYVRLALMYKFGRLKKDPNEIIEVGSDSQDRTK